MVLYSTAVCHVNLCSYVYRDETDKNNLQSTFVISNPKGLSETLRDIRTSKYQSCRSEENNNSNNHI